MGRQSKVAVLQIKAAIVDGMEIFVRSNCLSAVKIAAAHFASMLEAEPVEYQSVVGLLHAAILVIALNQNKELWEANLLIRLSILLVMQLAN